MTNTQKLSTDDFIFMSIEEATTPPGGIIKCIKDSYWPVDADGRIAFFNPRNLRTGRRLHRDLGFPQCNANEEISRKVSEKDEWAVEIRFIPAVFYRVNPSDFC